MQVSLEIEATSVVIVGVLNPAIFTPHWLSSNGLIEQTDADEATVTIIHPDISSFQTSWFNLTVERERFTIQSLNTISIRVFDLLLRLFGDCLPHTPLSAAGINYLAHFRVASYDVLNQLGDALGPKGPWGEWGAKLSVPVPKGHVAASTTLGPRSGGLRSIVMTQYARPDGLPGHVQAKIEPSLKYRPGVFVEFNDHYQIEQGQAPVGANSLLMMIQGKFDSSVNEARALTSHFMHLSNEYGYGRNE